MQRELPSHKIRSATFDDLESICDIWEELADLHARIDPVFTPASDGRLQYLRWLKSCMRDDDTVLILAELDHEVVGYCLAQLQTIAPIMRFRRVMAIADVAVREPYRRRGIGRDIVREVEKRSRDLGIARIEMKNATHNEGANHFWESVCGFEEFIKIRSKTLMGDKE